MAKRPRTNSVESLMASALDKRSVLGDIDASILPVLRQALREGWSHEKLANDPRIQLLLTAKQLTIALQDDDSSKALAAIKDMKDRTIGKPTERLEVKTALEKASDDELDALLKTKLSAAAAAAKTDERH